MSRSCPSRPFHPGVVLFHTLFLGLILNAQDNVWQSIHVPGTWRSNTPPKNTATPTVWYRCWVKVPDSYFTPHERNLFEESVGIHIRDLEGAHELWVNGKKIGSGGALSPDYRNGPSMIYRHKVPPGTLVIGAWNEIALQVQAPNETGGFRGEAPFIMDYFLECILEGGWEFLVDSHYTPGTAATTKPLRAAFEDFRESQRVIGRTQQVHGPSLAPHESADLMQASDELKTDLLLYEPIVTQPFHFTFDERGRLWVAQSRQYPYPAGIQMLSRDKYYRAHYDSTPPAPPNHTPGADRITIHEDTDGDGNYDLHKTFVEGLNLANSAIRGWGGVWIMHTPHLLFYPDFNNDDIPDGPPEVRLTGFGFEDTHSISNGLVWGPDGWLYGGQGSTCSCRVTRPDVDSADAPGVYFEGCMVWRYHPETRAFEIFAEGGGNTYGLEFDAQGRLYSGHNGGDTRGWHFVQGGFYQMQGVNPGKFGPPRNPYAFGELPMMSTPDRVVRFTHFGAFVEGTALPLEFKEMLFAIDPLHNEVIATKRFEHGSTFSTLDHGVVVKSLDPAFRPIHIANAPDGSMIVSDMYEYYIAHGQHYQNQIDPTTGRIFRISGKDMPLETDLDLAKKTPGQLMDLLGHPNKWHRHTAVRLLGERKNPPDYVRMRKMVINASGLTALNALWALAQAGGLDNDTAIRTLQHTSPSVRLWTARFLGDIYGINRNLGLPGESNKAETIPSPVWIALINQARIETHAEVRSQFASTARRLVADQGFALASAIMAHSEDLDDPYIPLLCWWVFESHLPANTREVIDFLKKPEVFEMPMAKEKILPRIARRLTVDGRRNDLIYLAELFEYAQTPEKAAPLLMGYEEAFRGRSITGIPFELEQALNKISKPSLSLRLRQGDVQAFKEAYGIIQDTTVKVEDRLLYTRMLGEIRQADNVAVLLNVATTENTDALRMAAFASLAGYDDDSIARATIVSIPTLPDAPRMSALTLLSSRPKWANQLFSEIQKGTLNAALIPDETWDLWQSHGNAEIRDQAKGLFPSNRAEPEIGFMAEIKQVEAILKVGAGNPYAGETTFMQRCGLCHKLFFKGGNVGPDLTSYQRKDLGTMLNSILNPNAEIREGYQFISVETTDGRSLSGFQIDRDTQVMTLRGLDGQDTPIRVQEIESVQAYDRSMMPEGLLTGLDDQQLRDLFAYLRISQPISN